jgi:hypothetical protein
LAAVHVIHPNAVYTPEQARLVMGMTKSTVSREVRLARLRISRRGGRYLILGSWLLQWVRQGEMKRAQSSQAVNGEGGGQ